MGVSIRNRYLVAFSERLNLLALAGGVALPIVFGQPLLLLIVGALEVCYLVYVPPTAWYAQRLQQRGDAAGRRRREAKKARLLPTLCTAMQDRFERLEIMHRQAYEQTREVQRWFTDAPRKFDYLLDTFLEFAGKQAVFLQYLSFVQEEVCGSSPVKSKEFNPYRTVTPIDPDSPWVGEALSSITAKYTEELASLREKIDREGDETTRALLAKHAHVLTRRAEFIEKLAKTLANLNRQLQLLEDTFGLINDVMLARKPEEAVLADIDDVMSQTDAMARVLKEMAASEQVIRSLDRIRIAF